MSREISAPARQTRAVLAAMPTDTDALSGLPFGNTGTKFIDYADDFVPWNAGILNAGPNAFFGEYVAMANAAGLHLDCAPVPHSA